jgi:hypothetical protein
MYDPTIHTRRSVVESIADYSKVVASLVTTCVQGRKSLPGSAESSSGKGGYELSEWGNWRKSSSSFIPTRNVGQ